MKKTLIIILISISYNTVFSQITGEVDYKYLGINFMVPDGWLGQETQGAFIMGSNTIPGFLLVSTHQQTNLNDLINEAKSGIMDENGTMLTLTGDLEKLNEQSVGGLFNGTLEGNPAKAYIIGMINPFGTGTTIMAITTPDAFNEQYINLAKSIANSMKFRKPEVAPIVDQWKEKFSNARLTYLDSYQSSGGSYNGYSTGGGYSSEEVIDLCEQGYFNFRSNSSTSIDTGGAFGSSSGSGAGQGKWEIRQGQNGNGVLVLTFNSGDVKEYELTYDQNGKTFLNGYRYFVTYGTTADDGPDCY